MSSPSFHHCRSVCGSCKHQGIDGKYKAMLHSSVYLCFPYSSSINDILTSQIANTGYKMNKMPKGLDIMIAFISSTAIIFNISTYILPLEINRAFSSIITIIPKIDRSPSFDFGFNGRCFANDIRVSCLDSILEITQASSTGYEDFNTYREGHRYYSLMRLVMAAYSICMSPSPHHSR